MPRKNSRAANNSGSIRHRADGTYEGRISAGYNPTTGKPKRISIYGKTQSEVRRRMTEALHQLDTDTYTAPQKITIEQWFDRWITVFCDGKCKPHTISTYRSKFKVHVLPAIGALKLQDAKPSHIQKLYNDLKKAGKSPKTIHDIAGLLKKIFNDAIAEDIIQKNPCDKAEPPQVVKKEAVFLSDDEVPIFRELIKGTPFANAYELCLYTGLRSAELRGLSWRQVDLENGFIVIDQQLHKGKEAGSTYTIASTKTDNIRRIGLMDDAIECLKREKIVQSENRLKAGAFWDNEYNLVFTDAIGHPYADSTFYKTFKRIAATMGHPELKPHSLRHTAGTIAIEVSGNVKFAQKLLGHSSSKTTTDIYAHLSNNAQSIGTSKMQERFERLKKQSGAVSLRTNCTKNQ